MVMTTIAARAPIATFQDILDAMAQNPELKAEMRRHLHDEDFQNLPRTVALLVDNFQELTALTREIVQRQDRHDADIAEVKAGQARHDADIAEVKAGQARHDADIAEVKAGQDRHEADIAEVKAGQDRHEADIAEVKAGQARHEADIAEVKAGQDRHEADIADVKAGQARHDADIAELKDGQARLEAGQARHDADISELKAGQARIISVQSQMQGRLNRLSGTDYERKIARRLRRQALRHFGLNDAVLVHSVTLPNDNALPDLLDNACAQGLITNDEAGQAEVVDIVISGVAANQETAYAVIEASIAVDNSDVARARDRADIIGRAAGVLAQPAVVGIQIPDAIRQAASAAGVAVIIMPD